MIIETDIKALNEIIQADDNVSGTYGPFLLPCVITVTRGVVENVSIDISHWGPQRRLLVDEKSKTAALVSNGDTDYLINYYRAVELGTERNDPVETVHAYIDFMRKKERSCP